MRRKEGKGSTWPVNESIDHPPIPHYTHPNHPTIIHTHIYQHTKKAYLRHHVQVQKQGPELVPRPPALPLPLLLLLGAAAAAFLRLRWMNVGVRGCWLRRRRRRRSRCGGWLGWDRVHHQTGCDSLRRSGSGTHSAELRRFPIDRQQTARGPSRSSAASTSTPSLPAPHHPITHAHKHTHGPALPLRHRHRRHLHHRGCAAPRAGCSSGAFSLWVAGGGMWGLWGEERSVSSSCRHHPSATPFVRSIDSTPPRGPLPSTPSACQADVCV